MCVWYVVYRLKYSSFGRAHRKLKKSNWSLISGHDVWNQCYLEVICIHRRLSEPPILIITSSNYKMDIIIGIIVSVVSYTSVCTVICCTAGFVSSLIDMAAANESSTAVTFHHLSTTFVPLNFTNNSLIVAANDTFCRHLLYMNIPPSL